MPQHPSGEYFAILLEIRDTATKSATDIGYLKKSMDEGKERMDAHSEKVKTVTTRVDALEAVNEKSDSRWKTVSEPVKLVGTVIMTLAATALWTWVANMLGWVQ